MEVAPPEAEVVALARRLAESGAGQEAGLFHLSWWSDRLLGWAMANDDFKTQLFRFTDVFPATVDDADVVRHVREYFGPLSRPRLFAAAVKLADVLPAKLTATIAHRSIERMAKQFIVGESPAAAVPALEALWRAGSATTVDLLGEKVVTEAEADRYASRVDDLLGALVAASARWPANPVLESDDLGVLPRASISIKPTALASRYGPLSRDDGVARARGRLLPILERAAATGCFVWFDMEHYDVKELTLELFQSLLDDPAFRDTLDAGVVIQGYLRDSHADLERIIAWAAQGRARPIGVRLVKGAYWDAETIEAEAEGWESPVYEHKADTDANYERCTRLLHAHHGTIRAAFGSHNVRSLAYAVAAGRAAGVPDTGYELQMLSGMAEPIQAAIRAEGLRLRVYCPVGELVPGMAYLVRRLLENTSNKSFVRQRFAEGRAVDELVAAPRMVGDVEGPSAGVAVRPLTDAANPAPYEPEPPREWRHHAVAEAFGRAVAAVEANLGAPVPARIAGREVMTPKRIISVDPAAPATTVAESASCTAADAHEAVAAALAAAHDWSRTPARERAAVLFRAAAWMRERRDQIAALEVFEAGKPWKEADGDVCEAIDFCEYYAREMLRLDAGGAVQSPPGEANHLGYTGKGVAVVIAPWNFPLAIPTGMTVAALVAGNATILKPAEQTPAVASVLVDALMAAGLPAGVLQFLPGDGEEVGVALVEHPDVNVIAFTGSRAVGLAINQSAAVPRPGQGHVKRVIAEMGGKNAVIVDTDADLDAAVPAIVYSAFGFAGQKCSAASRVIVVGDIYDELLARLTGATGELHIGHPRDMAVDLGPLIDADAQDRVHRYLDTTAGRVVARRSDVPDDGYFAGAAVVTDLAPDAPIVKEEIFGPVLALLRASDFASAVAMANDTDYTLTAGVMSRSPAHIAFAARELRAGNIYINRTTTGAVVGRQPFGGYGLSGVGSKAGGPDYLLQFMDPRVVTENTLRQGFAPPARAD